MRSIKDGYLVSGAAAMLVVAWVEPIPAVDVTRSAMPRGATEDNAIGFLGISSAASFRDRALVREDAARGTIKAQSTVLAVPRLSQKWVGLNERELVAALGPPTMEEERPPARLSSFRRGGCTLTVTLNPDVQTRDFHALDYEVISDANTARRNRECAVEFFGRLSQE